MVTFNYITGELNATMNPKNILMEEGWVPYYTIYGRYVGCKCIHNLDRYIFFNAHTHDYVDSYEDMAWDCEEHYGTCNTLVVDSIGYDAQTRSVKLTGRYVCVNCGVNVTPILEYECKLSKFVRVDSQ